MVGGRLSQEKLLPPCLCLCRHMILPPGASCPPWQIVLYILIHQERHPRRWQHPHHAGHHAPIKTPEALLVPELPHHPGHSLPELRLGIILLQPASEHLERVRHGAGNKLRSRREHHRGFVGHLVHRFGASAPSGVATGTVGARMRLLPPPPPPGKVHPPGRIVDGELHGPVAHGQHAHPQAPVEPPRALLPQQPHGAGPHARVGAGGGAVRGQHARLEHPDGVGDDLGQPAGGERGDEEVGGGEAPLGAREGLQRAVGVVPPEVGDAPLHARLEEEEGGPAGGVAEEVRREAAVEGGERAVRRGEGADERDGGEGRGRGDGAAVD